MLTRSTLNFTTKTNGDIKVLYVCNENYGYNLTQGKVYDLIDGRPRVSGAASRKPVYTTQ